MSRKDTSKIPDKPPIASRGWLLTLVVNVILIAVVGSFWLRSRRQSS